MGKVSLEDFIAKAKENGCEIEKKGKEYFIGNFPATNYPHIHIWKKGTIALSAGSRQNGKIGEDDEIDLEELSFQVDRYGRNLTGGLEETIEWAIDSDS
ncbi:hypothetical protein [Ulvibacter litoralis]|uniref:Uncharacterized protein n=1 Tax=Ulvibacter litoralis TaxID=227084 RepID=A0A1G7ITI0_9FLAO|nr:hypothetical protein [Ulvibacter litoralis]GHC63220.1 hypothetical protein GCM10008083_30550 [Ulvibacter litoralis]SDF15905.1 hypothetical protein SAMN05421855_1077 [Ulvibacter litoralis]